MRLWTRVEKIKLHGREKNARRKNIGTITVTFNEVLAKNSNKTFRFFCYYLYSMGASRWFLRKTTGRERAAALPILIIAFL